MGTLIKAFSDAFFSVSDAMHGRYQSPSPDVQRWSSEMKNTDVPTSQEDKDNLRSDVSKIGKSLKKAVEKAAYTVAL